MQSQGAGPPGSVWVAFHEEPERKEALRSGGEINK